MTPKEDKVLVETKREEKVEEPPEYLTGPPCASCGTPAKDNPHSCILALQATIRGLDQRRHDLADGYKIGMEKAQAALAAHKRICNGEPDENGTTYDGTDGACSAWWRGQEHGAIFGATKQELERVKWLGNKMVQLQDTLEQVQELEAENEKLRAQRDSAINWMRGNGVFVPDYLDALTPKPKEER